MSIVQRGVQLDAAVSVHRDYDLWGGAGKTVEQGSGVPSALHQSPNLVQVAHGGGREVSRLVVVIVLCLQ